MTVNKILSVTVRSSAIVPNSKWTAVGNAILPTINSHVRMELMGPFFE